MGITPHLLETQVRELLRQAQGTADGGSPLKMGGKTSPQSHPRAPGETPRPLCPLSNKERK